MYVGFFEDFEEGTPGKTVEAFVQAGGNADVLLTIHGPLDFDAVKYVSFNIKLLALRLLYKFKTGLDSALLKIRS
jgi:hypothetical protein